MNYNVTSVKDGYNETKENGYKLYEDEKRYYSVWMKNNIPDPTTWASLNRYGERDMPIFTCEYCDYQGWEREEYDTVTIIG
jgi:hypothetical protein|nr:MAG TPA: hypothetical protein [Caudoviricetes sp.]DAL96408.1 MAG TPA: hypothetical protein [Caudoviricetes sp.]